jgi:arginine decarboxylase
LEMAACDYALAMTGLTEPDGALRALMEALGEIDSSCAAKAGPEESGFEPRLPRRAMRIARALRSEAEAVPLASAPGRISAQYAWAYPPGVPLIAPGEVIDECFLDEAARLGARALLRGVGETLRVVRHA